MTHILVDHGSQIETPELDGIKPSSIEPALQKIQEVNISIYGITSIKLRLGFK